MTEDLTRLGGPTEYRYSRPSASMLETFPSPGVDYSVHLETCEFTSLCPVTGQPDFATVALHYTPDCKCIETKSLKLYLFAYRNERTFMEAAVSRIRDDLVAALDPKSLVVTAAFSPRGGISAKVVASHHKGLTDGSF